MQLLQTTTQLKEYKKRLERQQEVLAISTVFTIQERNELLKIYCNAIAIITTRIFYLQNTTSKQLFTSCL